MKNNILLYNELLNNSWLSKCGESAKGLYAFDAYQVKDINRAIKEISNNKWSTISLEARNNFTEFLCLTHRNEYNKNWNEQVRKIKDELYPSLVMNLKNQNVQDEFIDDIRWNVLSILMLSYYSEFGFQSEFFEHILTIYKSGHIPCGWHGKYPNGEIMIY